MLFTVGNMLNTIFPLALLLYVALAPFIQFGDSPKASFALLGHLVDGKIEVSMNLRCVAFYRKPATKTVVKMKKCAICVTMTVFCVLWQ